MSLDECFPTDVSADFEPASQKRPQSSGAAVVLCSPEVKEFEEAAPEEVQESGHKVARSAFVAEGPNNEQVPMAAGEQLKPGGRVLAVGNAHEGVLASTSPTNLIGGNFPPSDSMKESMLNSWEDEPLDLSQPAPAVTMTLVREQTPDNLGPDAGVFPATVRKFVPAGPTLRHVEHCGTESGDSSSPLDLSYAQTLNQPLNLSLAAWPVRATASDPGWVHGRREPIFVKPRDAFSDGDSALQLGELSESGSVIEFDRTRNAPAVDAPVDLTASNKALSVVDPFEFAEPERPRFSAQALIDRGGPLADVHAK